MGGDSRVHPDGTVKVEIADGGELSLRFGINAMCQVEAALDMSIQEVGDLLQAGKMRVTHLRVLFHAALSEAHPDIKIGRAGDIMTEIGPGESAQLIGQAFQAAFPQEGDAEPTENPTGAETAKPKAKKPAAGTGSAS